MVYDEPKKCDVKRNGGTVEINERCSVFHRPFATLKQYGCDKEQSITILFSFKKFTL